LAFRSHSKIIIATYLLISNATNSLLPVGAGLGVRSNLTKRQIEVTMFAAGAKEIRELENGRLVIVDR
jgi:hypothetical protein